MSKRILDCPTRRIFGPTRGEVNIYKYCRLPFPSTCILRPAYITPHLQQGDTDYCSLPASSPSRSAFDASLLRARSCRLAKTVRQCYCASLVLRTREGLKSSDEVVVISGLVLACGAESDAGSDGYLNPSTSHSSWLLSHEKHQQLAHLLADELLLKHVIVPPDVLCAVGSQPKWITGQREQLQSQSRPHLLQGPADVVELRGPLIG